MAITKVSRGLLSTGVSDSSDATAITIDSSERVGIGTTNPPSKLTVSGSDGGKGIELQVSTGSVQYLMAYDRSASDYIDMQIDAKNLRFGTNNGAERMRIDSAGDLKFNSGFGSVGTAYGVRAWVKFQGDAGIGGSATSNRIIDGSGNVSSVGYIGAGRYQMNFTNSMPDTNYAVSAAAKGVTNHNPCAAGIDIASGAVNVALFR